MANFERMQATLAQIQVHQDLWNQSKWKSFIKKDDNVCQTAYCTAGWAAVLFSEPNIIKSLSNDGNELSHMGQNVLDLTDGEAEKIFYFTRVRSPECDCSDTYTSFHTGYKMCDNYELIDEDDEDDESKHNIPITFAQLVEQVETVLPGFTYVWVNTDELASLNQGNK